MWCKTQIHICQRQFWTRFSSSTICPPATSLKACDPLLLTSNTLQMHKDTLTHKPHRILHAKYTNLDSVLPSQRRAATHAVDQCSHPCLQWEKPWAQLETPEHYACNTSSFACYIYQALQIIHILYPKHTAHTYITQDPERTQIHLV